MLLRVANKALCCLFGNVNHLFLLCIHAVYATHSFIVWVSEGLLWSQHSANVQATLNLLYKEQGQ